MKLVFPLLFLNHLSLDIRKNILYAGDLLTKVDEIRKLAKKYNCEYIAFENDFATILIHEDEELYSIEGIHPLEKGYELMAKRLLRILKLLNRSR